MQRRSEHNVQGDEEKVPLRQVKCAVGALSGPYRRAIGEFILSDCQFSACDMVLLYPCRFSKAIK